MVTKHRWRKGVMTSYCWKRSVKNIVTSKTFYGSWLNAGSLFFYKTRVQISSTDFCTLFFLPAEPLGNAGAAIKLFEGSFTFKIWSAQRGCRWLLQRFVKSGTFTVSIGIAMPQPIAANLNGASTILAEAFPASFITFDPLVFYRLDYIKKTERLICKVMLDLRSGATAGSGFSIAETIGEDRHDISASAFANPFRFTWFWVWVFLYYFQLAKCFAPQINEGGRGSMPKTAAWFCTIGS